MPRHQYKIVFQAICLRKWTFSAHALSDQTCLFLEAFASNQIHWKHKEKMIAGVMLNKRSVIFLLALFAHVHNERKLAEVLIQEKD